MESQIQAPRSSYRLLPIFLANLLFSFHFNVLVYVNSSFLEKFFSTSVISLIYVLGSVWSIVLFFISIKMQGRRGNRQFFLFFMIGEFLAVLGLALLSSPLIIILLFTIFEGTSLMVFYSMDIFLEDATPTTKTGWVRGMYLTTTNLAIAISPTIIALAAPKGQYTRLYAVSLLFLMPIFGILFFSLKEFKDGAQRFPGIALKAWWQSKNVRKVTIVRIALDLFYSLMIIYMPLYLRHVIGFSWTQISVVFTIMLLPFILFQIPVGRMADNWCGEKELMTLGLFIMGISLILMPFLHGAIVPMWAGILFLSRVGASIVEITTESYFFKHVDKRDAGLISVFRLAWPTAFIIGPILGGLILYILPFEALFLFMAIIILWTMHTSAQLQDTL